MPSPLVRRVSTWLAGTMCLCLVPGCAGHSRYAQRCSETETVRPAVVAAVGQVQPVITPEARATVDRDNLPAPQTAPEGSRRASDRLLGFSPASEPATAAGLDALATSSATSVVQTAWAPQRTSGTNPPLLNGDSRSISEVLPAPGSPALHRTLSLREAIDTALVQNPDVVTARAAAPVALAARGVAATYPWNPTVQVGVFPYTRDAAGGLLAVKNQVAVTQTMELAHQPQHRRQAASAAWDQERSKIAQAEWTAATAAMRAYFDVLYKKGLLDLARESAKLGDDTVGAVDRRFAAGLATPTERIAANAAARRSQRRAEVAEADYQTALQALRVVLNTPPDEDIAPSSTLAAYQWLPLVEALDQDPAGDGEMVTAADSDDAILHMTASRPDVAAARHGASAAEANLDLARADMIPNVTAGPSYERDESGTVFVGLTAQMDLPIWNSGCPLVRQRSAEMQQQLITWRQTQARAVAEARAAADRYERARRLRLELSEDTIAGNDELKSLYDAFENGQASIIEVLATKDNLIQERQAYLDLLNQVSQTAVDVIAALAIDPDRLIEAPLGAASHTAKQE